MFAVDPYYGNLNKIPEQEPRFGAGFVQFESEGGSRELWVDQHSQQMKNLEPLGADVLVLLGFRV